MCSRPPASRRWTAYPISYTFAATPTFVNAPDRAGRLCAIATQEAAHAYGLDHLFTFVDGSTSCSDAMTSTFRECGIKYFRNVGGKCGEMTERPCRCGPVQNTHLAMTQRLGVGSPTTIATASITSPVEGPIENGATIVATASADRGVVEVTFRLDGYTWKTLPGAPLNAAGQLATPYEFQLPTDVPDGVIDIEVEAVDDLGASAKATVTVTKGAPCATEDTCAAGQFCDAGRCIWPAPIGNIGDECTYAQFCLEPRCDSHGGESRCTRACVPGLAGACELGLERRRWLLQHLARAAAGCADARWLRGVPRRWSPWAGSIAAPPPADRGVVQVTPAGADCWSHSSRDLPWGLLLAGFVAFLVSRRR